MPRMVVIRPPVISPARPVISPENAEEESAKVKRDAQRIDFRCFMSNLPVTERLLVMVR